MGDCCKMIYSKCIQQSVWPQDGCHEVKQQVIVDNIMVVS